MKGKMGKRMENERRILEIFESGTRKEVLLLLKLEVDPQIIDEQRALITRIRKGVEGRKEYIDDIKATMGKGNYRTSRTPNLSQTEWNND